MEVKTKMSQFLRRVIRISAEDSPNIQLARKQIAEGLEPTDETAIPGILTWSELEKRRSTWDRVRQCIGLDGQFWEGAEVLLFPPEWLNRAEQVDRGLRESRIERQAKAIGIDPAEGGDRTAMAVVDELGLIELVSKRTPDTAVITGEALAFMQRWKVEPERVVFDRGGGGKEHADRLRSQGWPVRSVSFAETFQVEPRRGLVMVEERKEVREERYAYRNRRAEMYGNLRQLLDPAVNPQGFGIGREEVELRRQLAPIPLTYDGEGRLELLPKSKREGGTGKCLIDLIGHSPDEADALVLAIHGMQTKSSRVVVRSMV